MQQYLDIMSQILNVAEATENRTGVDRYRIFGTQTRYKSEDGFPLDTTSKVPVKALIHELLFFIRGSTDVRELQEAGVKIWDKWAFNSETFDVEQSSMFKVHAQRSGRNESELALDLAQAKQGLEKINGWIGPMYGAQWRYWPADQNVNTPSDYYNGWEIDDFPKEYVASIVERYDEFFSKSPYPEQQGKRAIMDGVYTDDFKYQLRLSWGQSGFVDQLAHLVYNLKKRPYEARHVVSAWNATTEPLYGISPQENITLNRGALPACHALFQCFVEPPRNGSTKKRLSLQLYQRSCDWPVGVRFNIAQYALLKDMLAHVCDMEPGDFIHSTGDTHIYADQIELAKEHITRIPYPAPKLWLNPEVKSIFDFTFDDIKFLEYDAHPTIPYPVAE